VVDHGNVQETLRPSDRLGIGALAREEQGAQFRQVVTGGVPGVGILLADRPDRRRRRARR
jgi:hypothetical protein